MDTFRFKLGNLVHLTDPCYDSPENTGEMCFDNNGLYNVACLEGDWIATRQYGYREATTQDRVTGFTVVAEGVGSKALKTKHFRVGVDSGQFGIFDASIFDNNSDYDVENSFYRTVCDITLQDHCGTVFYSGFVSSSGYGDGSYDLFCGFLDGVLAYASITFIYDEDEDEDAW